ncbi:MAG: hypothetical protein NTW49_00810 [Bacteroidia bacterium]|nr:hypothetical protein [Bacteroidia bacterium]
MKKLKILLCMLAGIVLLTTSLKAQETAAGSNLLSMGIPPIALLSTTTNVSLVLTTSTPGAAVGGGTGTAYLQLSSIVAANKHRTVTASVGGIPTGVTLAIAVAVPSNGNWGGITGTGCGATALVNGGNAVTVVSGIGSCYTGTGPNDGYIISYTSGAAGGYGSIVASTGTTATVTLTLTDDI